MWQPGGAGLRKSNLNKKPAMKVYVLTYKYDRWAPTNKLLCVCKYIWEIQVYATREAAEAAAEAAKAAGGMFHTICEKEVEGV